MSPPGLIAPDDQWSLILSCEIGCFRTKFSVHEMRRVNRPPLRGMTPTMLADVRQEFRRHQRLAQEAMTQLDAAGFFQRPAPHVNPVALIVKHLGGNLRSRWTGFLTSDGEKPDRDRDREFVLTDADTRDHLMAAWQQGWAALWGTLESLSDCGLEQRVTIRGEGHTVRQALMRGLTHVAYHTGQILYVVRLLRPESRWLTIPPDQSRNHPGDYFQSRTPQR